MALAAHGKNNLLIFGYTLMHIKNISSGVCLLFFIFSSAIAHCQNVRKNLSAADLDSLSCIHLSEEFAENKTLPEDYQRQTLQALSFYPELKKTKIDFRIRKQRSPLLVRPTVMSSIFRAPKKRTYLVLISSYSPEMDSILINYLPYDAQVGVIGHELAHISFFIQQSRFGIFEVAFGNLSEKFLDKIEFDTDRSTIDHGLGWQLLSWSEFVKVQLKMNKWKGIDAYIDQKTDRPCSRYMNPETIRALIARNPIYW